MDLSATRVLPSPRHQYRYFKQGPKRRKFERTPTGEFRYWDLARCLKDPTCPLDEATKCNLRFLIKLRNEIVHHNSAGVDERLSGRYFACCLNFEHYVCKLFGRKHSLGDATAIALNFQDIVTPHNPLDDAKGGLPANVAKFVQEFDADLPEGITDSHRFKCRLLFTPIVTSKTAQAERVVEFVRPDSDLGRSFNAQYRSTDGGQGSGAAQVPTECRRQGDARGRIRPVQDASSYQALAGTRRKETWERLRSSGQRHLVLVRTVDRRGEASLRGAWGEVCWRYWGVVNSHLAGGDSRAYGDARTRPPSNGDAASYFFPSLTAIRFKIRSNRPANSTPGRCPWP